MNESQLVLDPVCGMRIDPADAVERAELDAIKDAAGRAMGAVLDVARASPWPEDRHAHTDVQDSHHGAGVA